MYSYIQACGITDSLCFLLKWTLTFFQCCQNIFIILFSYKNSYVIQILLKVHVFIYNGVSMYTILNYDSVKQ